MGSTEASRLAALHEYGILDAPAGAELDAVVRMAAFMAGVPTATLNLLDAHRQCQLTTVGFQGADTPREDSMCAVRFGEGRVIHVPDASSHPDYRNNPWVTGVLADVRFYASVPLITPEGHDLGTLCVFDSKVHSLSPEQLARLEDAATVILALFERRRQARQKAELAAEAAEQRLLLELTTGELETKKRFTDAILETVNVAIVAADARGRLTVFNRAARNWHGMAADRELNPALHAQRYNLYAADGTSLLAEHEIPLQRALRDGQVHNAEMIIAPRHAEPVRVLASGRSLTCPDGTPLGAVVAMTDVTTDRQQQAALQAAHDELARSNSELEQFAAVASHDLKSPLSVVAGYLELVEEQGNLGEQAAGWVGTARRGVTRMTGLIDALLDYSRAGEGVCARELVQVRDVFDAAVLDLHTDIGTASATVTTSGELPATYCDATLLRQLLQNLVGNALKYRHQDRPCRIVLTADAQPQEHTFAVADNGPGIPAEHRHRIFDMFATLDPAARTGHGLGLATCKRIVERHGGRIWAEETPGGGATIFFTLPQRDR